MKYFQQLPFSVRLEWGSSAVRNLGSEADCIVVIDIMSFSTCVSIAVDRGAIIYPYPWRDETAKLYGDERGAAVASGKRRFADGWSLSPQSMLNTTEGLKLVLPSPNGSTCTFLARELNKVVYCASLRNLAATAAVCQRYERILVVPCGERWEDDNSLRPCFEDYLAAGGFVSALARSDVSPEARTASFAYDALGANRSKAFSACGSAVELTERGFAGDVALCLEENISHVACRLEGDRFVRELVNDNCPI
ncbi:MAG: 2-phosphosulfolactate phosphatase [Cytophagales bacterium]|nr:2-phosphosulfolactate phosphatase [Cytophagales bacterium]